MDRASENSMQSGCVFDVAADITQGAGHEIGSPRALARALDQLGTHVGGLAAAQSVALAAALE